MLLHDRPRKSPTANIKSEDNGCIEVSANKGQTYVKLNESASLIWQLCDGEKTASELIELLVDQYPDEPNIGNEVEKLIQDLIAKELILIDGGAESLEYQGDVVRTVTPTVELQWQLEQIRQFLFGAMRLEEAQAMQSDLETLLGNAALANAKSLDVDSASQIDDSRVIPYRGALKSPSMKACLDSIVDELKVLMPEVTTPITISGHAIYLKGAHMGWHSNHSRSDGRIYCSWAQSANSNFFRYEHPITGEIITQWEEPGWNIKSFTIPPATNRFWHSIGANSLRLSLGFRYNLPNA
jgi:hypothetical protein